MELISEDKESATLRFSSQEYATLSSILMVFEHKLDGDSIDEEMMISSLKEVRTFLDDFTVIFER